MTKKSITFRNRKTKKAPKTHTHGNKGIINYLRMKEIYAYLLNIHNLKVYMLRTIAEVGSYMVKFVDEDFIC
jgi:hypothetical protein